MEKAIREAMPKEIREYCVRYRLGVKNVSSAGNEMQNVAEEVRME